MPTKPRTSQINMKVTSAWGRRNGKLGSNLPRVQMNANAPDLQNLTPQSGEFSVPVNIPVSFQTELNWEGGLLSIEEFLLRIDDGMLELAGKIDNPPRFDRTYLDVDLHIADIHSLSALAGTELPHESADLVARLLGNADTVMFQKFEGKVGDNEMSGDFSWRFSDAPEMDLQIVASRINLTPYPPGKKLRPPLMAGLSPTIHYRLMRWKGSWRMSTFGWMK